jgi:hypothetical protein
MDIYITRNLRAPGGASNMERYRQTSHRTLTSASVCNGLQHPTLPAPVVRRHLAPTDLAGVPDRINPPVNSACQRGRQPLAESSHGPVEGQHRITYPHDPVLVALSAWVPRWPDVHRNYDRRRSPLRRSQQWRRGEIHALQPSCSRAWRTGLRQQVRGTQGGSGIEETRPHREVGLGSEMCADF